ncbi:MAG: hypothetical protein WC787_04040 [Patescibacteria group bacterium]
MAKKRSHPVSPPKEKRLILTIKRGDVKVRKALPPPVQTHRSAKTYRRKPKHGTRNEE